MSRQFWSSYQHKHNPTVIKSVRHPLDKRVLRSFLAFRNFEASQNLSLTANTTQKRAAFAPRKRRTTTALTQTETPAAGEPAAQKAAPAETAAAHAPKEDATKGGTDFTGEQDEQLLGLKGAGQSWKYIAITLDRSVGDVKHRYHQIKPKDDNSNCKDDQIKPKDGTGDAKEQNMNYKEYKAAEAKAKGLAAKAAKEEANELLVIDLVNDMSWSSFSFWFPLGERSGCLESAMCCY